ncbi:Phosphoesterase [Penicillium canariense]|uniref:Phosphoesterase n=1 Tax=Penicillium canariense TaxID=189055 RepID=A0A9W9LTF4_9EURO|nr:Phosphoesterase [Penicillium canariense]KAJ5175430.1 Phosphoesterase [Penicillium canariense]
MHPKSPINIGENFMKSIYEALRSSPQWNQTPFIVTRDEHGGFAAHVSPPTGVPPGDSLTYTENATDGKNYTFLTVYGFKGMVQNKPSSEGNDFTHTSILKFVSELWGWKP